MNLTPKERELIARYVGESGLAMILSGKSYGQNSRNSDLASMSDDEIVSVVRCLEVAVLTCTDDLTFLHRKAAEVRSELAARVKNKGA